MIDKPIESRNFENTHLKVTRTGLGGEGVLRNHGRIREAREIILEAFDQGIGYFGTVRGYSGSEPYYRHVWNESLEIYAKIFQGSNGNSS